MMFLITLRVKKMKLIDYLIKNSLTVSDFASKNGLSYHTVAAWVAERTMPTSVSMALLNRVTHGAVSYADFPKRISRLEKRNAETKR